MLYDPTLFSPGRFRAKATLEQVDPGETSAVYEIRNGADTSTIGWLVEIAGTDVVSGSYTWSANQAYWFWSSGGAFPSGFRLQLYALNTVPGFNPANATGVATSGPFDTSVTVTPATGGSWWTIAKDTTPVGYLNLQQGGTQNWYETAANLYLTITGNEQLIFDDTSTAPTTAMYRVVCGPVSTSAA
ncbi:MAG: hypothetical protein H0V89_00840 [Deltaproteobacteria bacterium]|nr:hypothetical protein [Deltaproteobacteria bacterium]